MLQINFRITSKSRFLKHNLDAMSHMSRPVGQTGKYVPFLLILPLFCDTCNMDQFSYDTFMHKTGDQDGFLLIRDNASVAKIVN